MEKTKSHEALRRRIEQERGSARNGRTARFSTDLKAAVGTAAKTTTLGQEAFATALGISMSSLNRWRSADGAEATPRRAPPVKKLKGRLRPVGTLAVPDARLTLELPGGARILGLDIEQVARLLRESR